MVKKIFVILAIMIAGINVVAQDITPQQKQINIVLEDTVSKRKAEAVVVGTITIKSTGQVYTLYRGAKGGYFYFHSTKKDKKGNPQKVYLTKQQKQQYNLK